MKRKLLFVLAILLITTGLFLFVQVLNSFKTPGKGALQINTSVKAKVFLNGEEIGTAPLCKCSENDILPAGEYTLRLEPLDTSLSAFTTKISINGGVLTAVERTFLPGAYASASILTLEKIESKKPELVITTLPASALITIDSVSQGATPFKTDSLSVSEHELILSKDGFQSKTIRIRTVEGHRLVVQAYLGTASDEVEQLKKSGTEEETQSTDEEDTDESKEASETQEESVTILNTPTGFLRIRDGAGTQFSEVGTAEPGDTYPLISEEGDWYEIEYEAGKSGWVSAQYAKKN